MSYKLKFTPLCDKEFKKLDASTREQFKKKLKERVANLKLVKDKLSGYTNIYKIKLRSSGFRLVYEVKDEQIVVLVLSVGKSENDSVYNNLKDRI